MKRFRISLTGTECTFSGLAVCFFVVVISVTLSGIWAPCNGQDMQWNKSFIEENIGIATWISTVDMNDDGKLDVVATLFSLNAVVWYEAPGWTKHSIDDNLGCACGLFISDLDSDGDLDIVATGNAANNVVWYEAPLWIKHIIDDNLGGANGVYVADMNNDDTLDVVAAAWGDNDIVWYEGPTWTKHFIEYNLVDAKSVYAADMNGDDTLDVVATGTGADDVVLYEGPNWKKIFIDSNLDFAYGLDIADMDGDNDLDIVACGADAGDIIWYEAPAWTPHVIDDNLSGAEMVYIYDMDNDNDLDVAATGYFCNEVVWYEAPAWTKHTIDNNLVGAEMVYICDIDNDNDPDCIATQYVPSSGGIVFYEHISSTGNVIVVDINGTGDFVTIQAAIDSSVSGDTVLVLSGTYFENINFKGKAITVASQYWADGDTNHINNTVINGSQSNHPDSGSVVYFISGEDTNSVLTGFTITGGKGTYISYDIFNDKDGGGIFILNSGAKIEKNKIINNHITATADTFAAGAGIFAIGDIGNFAIRENEISNNSATVTGNGQAFGTAIVNTKATCIFENNQVNNNVCNAPNSSAFGAGLMIDGFDNQVGNYIIRNNIISNNKLNTDNGAGGGVVIQNCSPIFSNNIISGNIAASWGGGGVWVVHFRFADNVVAPNPLLINNTIINNSTTGSGGGILVGGSSQSDAYLMNNILWGNSGSTGAQIATTDNAGIEVQYSVVQGGYSGVGNIDADPLLVADSLTHTSPGIGAGTLECDFGDGIVLQCPSYDINGRERPYPAGSNPDIGAWESMYNVPVGINPQLSTRTPKSFTLEQNYPNPFNPKTIINYLLPMESHVELSVYNVLGKKVFTIVNEKQSAGEHAVPFEANNLSGGIYFYKIKAGEFEQARKMLLLK